MGKSDLDGMEEVANHIRKEILTAVPIRIEHLSTEKVEVLRSKLHILRYYCLRKGVDSGVTDGLEAALETSQAFWELLEDNANTLADLKETHKMRWLDLGSGVLTELEEVMSGEESFRDVVVNSIAILLGWKSDTVWVEMAEEDRRLVSRAHLERLRDELWRFIGESSENAGEATLKRATEIGGKMDALLRAIAGDDMPVALRVLLLSQIYLLLLRLDISKILLTLETDSEDA